MFKCSVGLTGIKSGEKNKLLKRFLTTYYLIKPSEMFNSSKFQQKKWKLVEQFGAKEQMSKK